MYQISSQYLQRQQRKNRKTKFHQRAITPLKYVKRDETLTRSVLSQDNFIYQISSQYLKRRQRKPRKTKFQQRAITPVKEGKA